MDDVLSLIRKKQSQDSTGVIETTPVAHDILCRVQSVSQSEFFQGGKAGLKPSLKFTVAAVDYGGEIELTYHDNAYSIYRTYHIPGTDYLELYAERKAGVANGKKTAG